MKTSNKLMEERGALVEELENILDTVASDERDFTDTENERQDEIHAKIVDLDDAIQRAKNNEAVFAKKATKQAVAVDMSSSKSEEREMGEIAKRFSLTEGIRSLAQGRPLEGVLREMDQEARKEASESGISLRGEFNIPAALSYGKRTAYGVDSTDANITNSTNSNGMVQENALEAALSLQAKSVIAQAGATQLSGFAGDVKLPTMPGNSVVSDGGNGAASEGDAIAVGTSAFDSVTLKPTRFAGAVDISKHLMYSANGQLDDLFGRDLGNAIASEFDKHVFDKIVDRLETAGRIAVGTQATANSVAAATDFRDVGALVGKYLAGNPDDLARAFFLTPEMYGHLLGQTADGGGMIQAASFQEQLMGRPAYISTGIANESVRSQPAFGDGDGNDTINVSPVICADASDIFVCTWAGLSINVDVYTEALKGVVRVIADGYMDGNIRRVGSGAFLGGLESNTTYTTVA
jgi:HK97 family phage major capsid protein